MSRNSSSNVSSRSRGCDNNCDAREWWWNVLLNRGGNRNSNFDECVEGGSAYTHSIIAVGQWFKHGVYQHQQASTTTLNNQTHYVLGCASTTRREKRATRFLLRPARWKNPVYTQHNLVQHHRISSIPSSSPSYRAVETLVCLWAERRRVVRRRDLWPAGQCYRALVTTTLYRPPTHTNIETNCFVLIFFFTFSTTNRVRADCCDFAKLLDFFGTFWIPY